MRKNDLKLNVDNIQLAVKVHDILADTIEMLYRLVAQGLEESFLIILVSTENFNIKKLLKKEKRTTDMLFEVDAEASTYAVICQSTDIGGAYHFIDRLTKHAKLGGDNKFHCAALEVKTIEYQTRDVVLRLMATYLKSIRDEMHRDIIFDRIA